MLDQTLLGRLVVIRGHQKDRVRSGLAAARAKALPVLGVIAAGAGYYRNPFFGRAYRETDRLYLLLVRQRGGLARRTADQYGVGPVAYLKIYERFEYVEVDAFVLIERRDDGYA